jgi:hypothetical protein
MIKVVKTTSNKASKPSQNPPQTLPKRSQNLTKSSENQQKIEKKPWKQHKLKKKLPSLTVTNPLGRHFGRPKPPKRGPRGSQNLPKWAPKREKIEVQKQGVSRLDLYMDLTGLLMVFGMMFKSRRVIKLQKTNLTKTSKIMLPLRRNAKF